MAVSRIHPPLSEVLLTNNSRYNLKRRVTSLPPITSEVFTEKVLAAQASSSAAASRAAYERTCGACEKTYFSENAFDNHLGSQKHRSRVAMSRGGANGYGDDASSIVSSAVDIESQTTAQDDVDSEAEEEFHEVVEGLKGATLKEQPVTGRPSRPAPKVDSETPKPSTSDSTSENAQPTEVSLRRCLFCNYDSPTVPLNALHMERIHGMFIPERNYLVDLEGLIGSLYEKIYEFHECLYCQKLKPTIFGLQTHMRDKGHCKIPFGTEDEQLEIGEFYDFTSTYSDVEDDEDEEEEQNTNERGGAKLGARRKAKADGDDEEMEEGDGWETDSSASSLDSADLTAVPLGQHEHQYEKLDRHPHHSSQDPRPHLNKDGFHSHAHKHTHAAFYSDYELHLPSGRAVGHRSLNKYYRQNLHSHPSPAERQEQYAIEAARGSDSDDEEDQQVSRRNDRERGRALTSRANGGTGMMGVTDQKKRAVTIMEKKAKQAEQRERRKYEWGNNKQANSQKHFRVSYYRYLVNDPPLTVFRILFCSELSLRNLVEKVVWTYSLFVSTPHLESWDAAKQIFSARTT